MTEKEKMLAGDPYDPRSEELLKVCHKARKLLDSFNATESEDFLEKRKILKELLGNIEEGVWIEKPFFCDYGENINIGKDTFINFNCTFLDCNKISIGKNVLIGPGVQMYAVTHPVCATERAKKGALGTPYITYSEPINIGDNVWIGGNASILQGVTIGNNSVIGAGSVVTKSIPDNVVAGGNPCKIIKELK